MTLPVDRWLEMDLTWFEPAAPLDPQLEFLLDRVTPLLASVSGERGLFLNVGWLIDLVTEWTGDPDQLIPTQSRRTAQWAARSYRFLADFLERLRQQAAHRGLPDLRLGVVFVGWAHVVWPPELKIYDFDSAWYDRHPELYEPARSLIGMPDLHPVNRLRADDYPYAAFPDGLAEGAYFPDVFAAQWAHLSDFLNLDILHLRDGLTGPMIYTRNGPYGASAPADAETVARFSQAVRDLYRAIKQAAPSKLVFGYSSAISPVADWRVGCVDFEALVTDGYIDGWIEQTWGGAWQDWWHQLWKGWTFQTANLLTRGAMIARANQQRKTPCRFYNLIETWDGWEPWDTLHQVPHKLRWAMWAFTHASVDTPDGLKTPDGSYISWMNNGDMELLDTQDIAYLVHNLDAAQANALALERVYGYQIVYNRAMMAWLSAEHPDWNATEWIDDQAALLMKWGVPILASTRAEWLEDPQVAPDGLLLQVPGQLGDAERAAILAADGPIMAPGRADLLDAEVRERLGITVQGKLLPPDFYVTQGEGVPPRDRPYLPAHAPIHADEDTQVLIATGQSALLTRKGSAAYWQPPDWSEPFNQFVPKYQLGSTYPHFCAARLLHELARDAGLSHIEGITRPQPVTFHLWRSAGQATLLLGNLETGEFGDSRLPRQVRVRLSRTQLGLGPQPYSLRRIDANAANLTPVEADVDWLTFGITLPPEQCGVWVLES